MNITDIRIRRTYEEGKLKALVSVTIDQDLAVHDIKVIAGSERLFVAMPSRKDDNGVFRDIVHPITMEGRKTLEGMILEEYQKHLSQQAAYAENEEKSRW
ncbi:MAG: septation regulator SpoVG [Oscillospiraceae bacterium]|nr:septation regulator SpoVG [Oscillospiraceae bacterium]